MKRRSIRDYSNYDKLTPAEKEHGRGEPSPSVIWAAYREGRREGNTYLGKLPPEMNRRAIRDASVYVSLINPKEVAANPLGLRKIVREAIGSAEGESRVHLAVLDRILQVRVEDEACWRKRAGQFLNGMFDSTQESGRKSLIDSLMGMGCPEASLDAIVKVIDMQGTQEVMPVTFESTTGAVVKFTAEGRHFYAKIGPDIEMLAREAAYLRDSWEVPVLQPITPKVHAFISDPKWATLISHDATVQNQVVPSESTREYLELRRVAFLNLAREIGTSVENISKMPMLTDVFNEALAHFHLSGKREDAVYQPGLWNPVKTATELESRLGHLTRGSAKRIRSLLPIYRGLEPFTEESCHEGITLVDYDRRPDDIVLASPLRVKLDRGRVAKGSPSASLGAMWTHGVNLQAAAYVSFARTLGYEAFARASPVQLSREIVCWAFIRGVRVASFPSDAATMERGLGEAEYFGSFLKQYAKHR